MNWKLVKKKSSRGLVECIILEFPGSHYEKKTAVKTYDIQLGASRIPKEGASMTSRRSVTEKEGIRGTMYDSNNT
jgi:hypothetical protein